MKNRFCQQLILSTTLPNGHTYALKWRRFRDILTASKKKQKTAEAEKLGESRQKIEVAHDTNKCT
ncbi:MAG: hypothetical protein II670_07865 [Alphaproteobacteria bacterium]|nr:hypothetical protein [Alphaproteobacteria bacterium]